MVVFIKDKSYKNTFAVWGGAAASLLGTKDSLAASTLGSALEGLGLIWVLFLTGRPRFYGILFDKGPGFNMVWVWCDKKQM